MISVRIAQLKSRLSQYLKQVRRGHPIVVLERDTPVARIIPYEKDTLTLVVREPAPDSPRIGDIPMPPRIKVKQDIVELLIRERQPER